MRRTAPAHGAEAFSDIFGDVFGDIFGGARRGGASQMYRGADLRYEIELDLAEAVFGRTVEIDVSKFVECEICNGSGAAKGSAPVTCDTCNGSGQVRISQGFFTLQQTCPHCRGTGRVVRNPCDHCLGQGRVRRGKKLSVKIPAGVDSGDRVRLGGEGEAGRNGGPPGDLYVEVHVREHPIFERDGMHLSCEVPISFATASSGRQHRSADARRPGGAQDSGTRPSPAACSGCARRASNRCATTPAATCSAASWWRRRCTCRTEQRALLREFDESLRRDGTKHAPRQKSFLDGVKRFFSSEPP